MSADDTHDAECIGALFERFVHERRQMGWRYVMAPTHLKALQHFLAARGVTQVDQLDVVDTALLAKFRRELLGARSITTVNGYFSTLRALWRFLLKEQLAHSDVTSGLTRLPAEHFVPYLYTDAELHRIDRALEQRVSQARTLCERFSRVVRRTSFRLLSDCGLRVSEACGLDLEHYDARRRLLTIECSKFFKSRVIPLPRTTCRVLDAYLLLRNDRRLLDRADVRMSNALLRSVNGRRMQRQLLEHSFKQLLCDIGLYRSRTRRGRTVFGSTNLHALRHGFAVRCLSRWQQQRLDVDRLMPLLSGYMGHCRVSYTSVYLQMSPALRQTASTRFERAVLGVLDGHLQGHDTLRSPPR